MAKKKVKPEEESVVILPEDVNTANGCAEGETQPLCGFSHIRYIVIQEVLRGRSATTVEMTKNKTKTFTYPIKEAAAPLRHANKYLLGNQRVIVPGMGDDNLQYKYSYVGEGIQIHVFWATKKPKQCDKN
nr:MAG TPA: hypothetical protein [Bacteriophage sp.]